MCGRSGTERVEGSNRSAGLGSVGWAFYLACSWTWVIGMFLPLLLIRDFGWAGYAAFLVPNALGAAAMGVVLRGSGSSERFVDRHRTAVWAFSFVTSAFQWFFLANLLSPPGFSTEAIAIVLVAGLAAAGSLLASRHDAWSKIASVGAWLASAGLLAWVIFKGQVGPPAELLALRGGKPGLPFDGAALGGLVACCGLGFALCPYLDRTFHHACQRAGAGRVVAFALGFLVFFVAMVLGTLLYARPTALRAIDPVDAVVPLRIALATPIVFHIALQLGFTSGVHGAFLAEDAPHPALRQRSNAMVMLMAAALGVLAASVHVPAIAGLSGFEVVYRGFLAFYGLVFPAYVLVCAMPIGASNAPNKILLRVFAGTVLVAAPFYWLAFMERQYAWALAGVGIVIAGGVLARKFRPIG